MSEAVERLGGRAGVERLVSAFIDRCREDFVIGFLFVGTDRERIIRHEAELALKQFGADVVYSGRPLGQAHAPKRINQGHYRRRQAILRHVLSAEGVDEDLVDRWLAHQERFRSVVTNEHDCTGPELD